MDIKEIREKTGSILRELHPEVDFENKENLVDEGILDSFDLVTLVTELSETFDIEIKARDFVAENFNSLERISRLVLKLMEE